MIKNILMLVLTLMISTTAWPQTFQKGPYTVYTLAENVYHIEDANDSNPPGIHTDKDGNPTGMNNCSDMYLVVGAEKALLVDLSNAIQWDSTAGESLRSLVYERTRDKMLFITVTHNHGDHLGMLPAFYQDNKARFWIPGPEFKDTKFFPTERTTYFAANESFDLGGGMVINTLEHPGHTAHSVLFFLPSANLVFTGDAIGSGSGVWLFDYDSFLTYSRSIDNLILYLRDPANLIDPEKLVICGGHAWQRGKLEKLTARYVYDMKTLIERIGSGTAETEEMSAFIPYLDTNFRSGTATITWNREAAAKYAGSVSSK